DGQRREP
ncbi:hypothetical protein EC902281_1333, partial [Escherichia coli 90.2281]